MIEPELPVIKVTENMLTKQAVKWDRLGLRLRANDEEVRI